MRTTASKTKVGCDTPPSRHLEKLINNAFKIQNIEPEFEDRAFLTKELIQVTLPYSNPRGNPPVWSRKNGDLTLIVKPGYKTNVKTGEVDCIGYPYGSLPRILLYWLNSQAVKKGERIIYLGDSLNNFLRAIGLNPETGGGKRSDSVRLKKQMERLFRASISFDWATESQISWNDMQVAPKGQFWWDIKNPEQLNMFESWIELSEEFFNAITSSPVPLDFRAIAALKKSPTALDLYTWVMHRNYAATKRNKPYSVSWRFLHGQFGSGIIDLRRFKQNIKQHLKSIYILYPDLRIEEIHGGLEIQPSRLFITDRNLLP